jgi:hypothetical protein
MMHGGDVTTITSDKDWKALVGHLPADLEQLAREHRVLNPQWPNAKVTDAQTLLRMILLHVGADLPLRQTVAVMARAGGPKVAQVWLHKKMRCAQPFLAALVERMVSDVNREASPERWAGYEMLCMDGSTVSGPGAEGIDVRMHGVIRLHDLRVCGIRVTCVSEGETLRNFTWGEGQLIIVDRGYSNAPGIMWTVTQGADVLVRVNRGALPVYKEDGTATIDVLDWCRGLRGHDAAERTVAIAHGPTRRRQLLQGRLIGLHLPEAQALEARARTRREEGPSVTDEHLEASEYIVLFTTAPAARLSAERCVDAYRLRWQIELQWKRWKSLCHFDRLPNYRDDTMASWLTAKVLLGLLLDRIGSSMLDGNEAIRPIARQPWKLTSIIWPLIVSAVMPLRLANAAEHMPMIADHLDSLDEQGDPAQIEAFRNQQRVLDCRRVDQI